MFSPNIVLIYIVVIVMYMTMCAIMPHASLEALKNERVIHEITYCWDNSEQC